MAKASRTISHIEEQMNENAILSMWTQTRGIKVYPAYGIDKLKFSFIEKGAQGKGKSFDIYMECLRDGAQCFDNWAYDILHGRFERVLSKEKEFGEKYPQAYKYVTGEKAEKSVGICNSTNGGYCINASTPGEDGKSRFCNIPVSFHDLRHLAERYLVSYESRKIALEQIRANAESEARNWNKDADATPEVKEAEVASSADTSVKSSKPAQNTAKEKKPTPETTAVELKTSSLLEEENGSYHLHAFDKKNVERDFVFPKQYWDSNKYGKVGDQFKKKASEKDGIMVTLHFYVYNQKNYVAKIGK